jgi:hypothetical protein
VGFVPHVLTRISRWNVVWNLYNIPARGFLMHMRCGSHIVYYTKLYYLERGWDVLFGLKMDKTQSVFFLVLLPRTSYMFIGE